MTVIDINIDAGESYGAWSMGDDAGTFPHATSVNLACGFHGGDPASMFAAARLALEHGLAIGAHPGLPDLVGLRAPRAAGHARAGLRRRRLPGGRARRRARRARRDAAPRQAARRVLDARRARIPPSPTACCGPCTTSTRRCRSSSRRDRSSRARPTRSATRACSRPSPSAAMRPSGLLARRGTPGAVITDVDEAARRAVRMAVEGKVDAIDGTTVSFRPRTLCIHGDNPHAAQHRRRRPRRPGGRRSRAGGVLSRAAARRLRAPRRPHRSRGQRADPAPRAAPARRPPRRRDGRPALVHDAVCGVRRAPCRARRHRALDGGPPGARARGRRRRRRQLRARARALRRRGPRRRLRGDRARAPRADRSPQRARLPRLRRRRLARASRSWACSTSACAWPATRRRAASCPPTRSR